MIEFEYTRVGDGFVKRLVDMVTAGDSAVLLGGRDIGKRYLLQRVRDILTKRIESIFVSVEFQSERRLSSRGDILAAIAQAVSFSVASTVETEEDPHRPLLWNIDQIQEKDDQRPIVLIASNVDSLPHHYARQLLQEIQTRVKDGKLVVLLSGEENLCELVHGPLSDFNCAHQFVIQGFDRNEFRICLGRRLGMLNLHVEEEEQAGDMLFDLTGGNIHLLRSLLMALLESRARIPDPGKTTPSQKVSLNEIQLLAMDVAKLNRFGVDVFQHSVKILNQNMSDWDILQRLLKGEWVPVTKGNPYVLELAGICMRCPAPEVPRFQLLFASLMMESFARAYFNDRRWGDRYAARGQWPKAFYHYSRVDMNLRIRPVDADDRSEVASAVRSLCSALRLETTRGKSNPMKLSRLRSLFTHGCQQILGLPHALFLTYDRLWVPIKTMDNRENYPDNYFKTALNLISGVDHRQPGWKELSASSSRFAALAILPSVHADQCEAVVVGDFEEKTPLSRERGHLLKELLSHLVEAYAHATEVVKMHLRLQARDQHVRIANSIFEALGRTVRNPQQALELAARELRQLGYRRVFFCQVDPVMQTIRGTVESSEQQHLAILTSQTNYLLSDPLKDIQPYVTFKKEYSIVPDPLNEPLVNKDLVASSQIGPFAVVPMIDLHDEVVGTIHVEREDRMTPSREEAEDLMAFGRQLAIALDLSEMVNLQQVTLDKLNQGVLIVDRVQNLRYANKEAGKLLDLPTGWHGQNDPVAFQNKKSKPLHKLVLDCLGNPRKLVCHVRGLKSEGDDPVEVMVDGIKDESGALIGVMINLKDHGYLYRAFKALQLVGEAENILDGMHRMADAVKLLGHRWGRLYCVDENNSDVLISEKGYGFPDDKLDFDEHRIKLTRKKSSFDESWISLDAKEPIVFRWDTDCANGNVTTTRHGLRVTTVSHPKCPELFHKKAGDLWLDLPLTTSNHAFGRLTVDCAEDMSPEDFELLRLLSEMVNGLLEAMLETQQLKKQKEQWLREAGDKAIAMAAHNIGTHLAALDILVTRYRQQEEKCPPNVARLNDDLENHVSGSLDSVKHVKEMFTQPTPRPETFCLKELLETVLRSQQSTGKHSLYCPKSLKVEWDKRLIEQVLLQMLQNSSEIVDDGTDLQISLKVQVERHHEKEVVQIVYCDNGPGVPDDLKKRVFEPFFTRRPGKLTKGTGLGLYFALNVVRSHAGHFQEIGQFGEGAEFISRIPKCPEFTNTRE